MKAAKMIQTVLKENPLNAQLTAPEGVATTRPEMAPIVTPVRPTAATGIGSVITPAMTAANKAKKYQALPVRPAGGGINAITMPTRIGITSLNVLRVLFWSDNFSRKEEAASNKVFSNTFHHRR
jgi:hypothetical protein